MAKQKQSNGSNRTAYGSASRFARDNRRTLGILGAAVAGAGALFFGNRYKDQIAERWSNSRFSGSDAAGTPAA